MVYANALARCSCLVCILLLKHCHKLTNSTSFAMTVALLNIEGFHNLILNDLPDLCLVGY